MKYNTDTFIWIWISATAIFAMALYMHRQGVIPTRGLLTVAAFVLAIAGFLTSTL
ncbi:MAG: hypothetical protein HQL35_05625 [Alphaproteobacteria bacterium]|nr:hypothetical protein [Alphaproteobacteria bacterium]